MAVFAVNAFTRLQALQTLLQALQRLTELVLGIGQGRVNARLYFLSVLIHRRPLHRGILTRGSIENLIGPQLPCTAEFVSARMMMVMTLLRRNHRLQIRLLLTVIVNGNQFPRSRIEPK